MTELRVDDLDPEDRMIFDKSPFIQKRLEDWHFREVLNFFQTSVTNDKKCIRTIVEREVDGKLLSSMNDEEMAAALNMSLVHVKKFRIKLKRIQEVFSKDMDEEETELKSFLKDNSLGHLFNKLTISMNIRSVAKLKEVVDNETLDTAYLRIKFAEEVRQDVASCVPFLTHEASDCNICCRLVSGAQAAGSFAPMRDSGPGQVFMYKSADQPREKSGRNSETPKVLKSIPSRRV
ncbi:hypothetical protein GUITHDRAFT_101088 [Guillardia theta CCMP2712]|uniref:SAM domain-containing protein n=1 Tax=Guillardia theta (strain CCMP2712) TaxID=905079 RepID=L1JYV7_GUITC|nr:hypothetical protein GUITHDRAFT_101088 [Guillardia theta CCMP2712]EKX53385.1 hypothetical protein GUITHDRAFT_101088 [Guillardia theta CCMP2712]|eukprot:XP_005840365.1 hypothetical protein GUITHDRAFT_101088 [Guillardia theta CCMP2712]